MPSASRARRASKPPVHRLRHAASRMAAALAMTMLAMMCGLPYGAPTALAQAQPPAGVGGSGEQDDHADRPVAAINLVGLKRVAEQEVRNNIRTAVGDPYDPVLVEEDLQRLTRLGQFKTIDAYAQLQPDGTVVVTFEFEEQALIAEVQVVGNRLIADQELLGVVRVVQKGPRDDFLIQTARRRIEDLYRQRGHYLAAVSIDETELERAGLLIFRIIEGPRVKVRAVEFAGNEAFTHDQLKSEVKTRTALFLLRKGELDEERLVDDVAALVNFYHDRGYIDVRVDRRIDLSPDNTEAKVTFLIAEGPQYTLRSIRATALGGGPLKVFAPAQIAALCELKAGDAYSADRLRTSIQAVAEAYQLMGYVDVNTEQSPIRAIALRVPDRPEVELELQIPEGDRYLVNSVQINGNFLTQDRVIRRELRGLSPGRPFDATQIAESKRRLDRTRLFNEVALTVQPPDPATPEYRDVLVEVKERNTGSVNFGVAVGSDSGLFGEFSLIQNNFDVTDFPESFQELISGRAFRGAGQRFNATLRPGTEIFQYSMSVTEPHLFDSEYSLTVGGRIQQRIFSDYDEKRLGADVSLGRQFGDVWAGAVRGRIERVALDNIDPAAPTEVFLDEGPDTLTALGLSLTRTTIGTFVRPRSGSRLELSIDRYGALGGDIDFTALSGEYTVYFTLDEDFLGRPTTLRLSSRAGYIFDGRAPTYERFYLGGRSLRGFDFRTVSPKGIAADTGLLGDDPVGGTWLAFLGAQYEFPLLEDAMTTVFFIDSGTVTDDVGFEDWRIAFGAGIRLYIPQFGDVPIALDFAIPISKEDGDEEQIFSFSAEFPF